MLLLRHCYVNYVIIDTQDGEKITKVIDFEQLEAGELESPFEPRVSI